MPTYVLLTKLSVDSLNDLTEVEKNAHKWKKEVEKKCPNVKFISHYWLLGPYDFISIYEAPDEKEATRVSLISMSLGAQKAESWTALEYPKYLEQLRELKED